MIGFILDIIYPQVCGICGRLDKNSLCKKCEIQLRNNAIYKIDDYSQDESKNFDEHLYIFIYSGIIRKTILNYKFNDKSYIYKTFVKFLLNNQKFVEKIKTYDIIMPVPLSKKRLKERGYNQTGLIATEISNLLNINIDNVSLKKIYNNVAQSSLNKEERQKNIQGVYYLKKTKKLRDKKVLLVDDIYTTGSTLNECSKIVSSIGTKKIGVLTIAKD